MIQCCGISDLVGCKLLPPLLLEVVTWEMEVFDRASSRGLRAMRVGAVLFVGFCLLVTTEGVRGVAPSTAAGSALTRLLQNVTLVIPDLDLPPVKIPVLGTYTVSVTDLKASDFVVSSILVSDRRTTSTSDTIRFQVDDFAFDINANWMYQEVGGLKLHGKGTVTIGVTKSSVGMTMEVTRNEEQVPSHIHMNPTPPGCQAVFDISSMSFTGGLTAKLLEIFHKAIASALNSELSKLACTEVPVLVNSKLDELLYNASKLISTLVVPPRPPTDFPLPAPTTRAKLVDWSEWSVISGLDKILNARGKRLHHIVASNIVRQLENAEGALVFDDLDVFLNLGDDGLTRTNISISAVRINGLDSMEQFEMLIPYHHYGMSNVAAFRNLQLTVDGVVSLAPGSLIGHSTEGIIRAPASFSINATDVMLKLFLELAVLKKDVLHLDIGELLEPMCILGALQAVNVTQSLVDIADIGNLDIAFYDKGMGDLFNMIGGTVDSLFGSVLTRALRGAIDGPLRKEVNRLVAVLIAIARMNQPTFCKPSPPSLPPPSKDVNLSSNLLVKGLDYVLNDLIQVDSKIDLNINDVIDLLTASEEEDSETAGTAVLAEEVVSLREIIDGFGVISFNMSHLSMSGLDTFSDFMLLHPQKNENFLTETKVRLGSEDKPVSVNANMDLEITPSKNLEIAGTAMANYFTLSIVGQELMANASVRLEMNINRLFTGPLSSFQYGDCLLDVLDNIELSTLGLSFKELSIQLDCIACSSKALEAMSVTLASQEGRKQLSGFLMTALTTLENDKTARGSWPLERLANHEIGSAMNGSETRCATAKAGGGKGRTTTGHGEFTGVYPNVTFVANTIAIFLVVMAMGQIVWYTTPLCQKCRDSKGNLVNTLKHTNEPGRNESSSEMMGVIDSPGGADQRVGLVREKRCFCGRNGQADEKCLAESTAVPEWARLSIPLFTISAMFICLAGHVSIGASVIASVHLGHDVVPLPPLFLFSLLNSVHDMWTAGVYPLALLIAVFSGLWPYVKLASLLFTWYAPPWWISEGRRGVLLNCLDVLGKWSLIDLIVLVLMMVAFRFHIASPDSWYFLPPGVMKADIEVLANWGIFGFLLMTVISLIVTHVIIAFHRSDVGSVLDVNNEETDDKVNLSRPTRICNHSFRCGGKGGIRARFTRLGYSMLVFLGVVSILLTGIGAWVKSFSFKFLGLAGVALGDGSETHYSLISVANAVYHDDLASFVLWASFLCFTLAIPVAHLIVLLCLWTLPLRLSNQRNLFLVAEVLDAWGALEVFILSLFAALLEIRQFAVFIVGEKGAIVEPYLQNYFSALLPEGGNTLFSVGVTLNEGCFTLMGAAILGVIIGQVFTRLSEQALEDVANDESIVEDGRSEKACGPRAAKALASIFIYLKLMVRDYGRESAGEEQAAGQYAMLVGDE